MARRVFQGATLVDIPVDEIMDQYSIYLDEIGAKCATFAVNEIKKNAKKFEKSGVSANTKPKWWKNSGNLTSRIGKRKGRFNNRQFVAGATAPHSHLLEYGHVKWLWGENTGMHVPASPFVRPAEEALKSELPNIIRSVLVSKGIIVGGGN